MLLLDTADLPREHRVDAFRAAFDQASVPARVEHLAPAERVRARMHLWQFGGANLFTTDATGFRLVRTPKHVRLESPPVVALAIQSRGTGRFTQLGVDSLVRSGELMVSDLTEPYTFSWTGTGASRAFQVPYDLLGLPHDVVRRGAPRVAASPLSSLLVHHLRRLAHDADALAGDPGAAMLGLATVDLVRALLVSAAGDQRWTRAVRDATLLTRILAYAEMHLSDPALDAATLARVHNVSVRQLYKACAEAGIHLEQWLIDQRLERARAMLPSPRGRSRPIASTAWECGFVSPSHFARRFRQAYGLTPREWQRSTDQAARSLGGRA